MRVLFVDDNATNRAVVKSMLEAAGVETWEAEDAQTGLSMIDTCEFDLILMDIRMPGMDGLTAIRQIRARGDDKAALPVVVVTADNTSDVRQRAAASGADDLLLKPVDMTGLFDAIGRVLAGADRPGAMLG